MHVTLSALAFCVIGAAAAIIPAATDVEVRQEGSGTWYLIGFQPNCGTFGCNSDYAIFGAPDAIPGAPAFGLRCNTWGSCTNTLSGSTANAHIVINQGPLTITQTFSNGGKTTTATATVNWDGLSLASFTIPVTYTVS
ncbi:hypothetical protein F5B22DRAFT_144707 [Xylaria bambusicola]|uniref:uncharacterized protein n=1 Tax=Xylaria bambusicola TaxID=326684 RepID=UPI0020081088|nr:uncharacterized protein F5B22DRAFT_144707 [Xylaria bambusicola]KAI0517047.1 hypothetical protein F5B22DRAFT_144707 [Xylaria bambusicola]